MNLDSDIESEKLSQISMPEPARILTQSLSKITPEKLFSFKKEDTQTSKKKTSNDDSNKKANIPMMILPKKKGPVRRLMIQEIILENFKSYAGKQVIGPFHKRFTSVVGPNGSGKSNLIESLLFVFGKKASWMRLNKLYELIHSSAQHQNIKKASVEVKFQEILDTDDDEYEIIKGSQFTVKRVVYHTSVSKYEIDDEEKTQKEVVDLLKSKGIDLTNHRFLILQGEVEQISLMKPKTGRPDDPGLLEYLEDIIGSFVYKEKIDALDEDYNHLFDSKREKTDIAKISEKELENLESHKNLAIEYVKREKLVFKLLNVQHQLSRHVANKEMMRNEGVIEEVGRRRKEEEKKMREKIKDKENLLKNYKKKKDELDQLKDVITGYESKLVEFEKRDIKIRKDMEHQLSIQIKHEEQIKNFENEFNKIIENTSQLKKTLPKKAAELEKLKLRKEAEEESLSEMMTKLNKNAEKYRRQKKEIEDRLNPSQTQLDSLKNEQKILENELNLFSSKNRNYNEELRDLSIKHDNVLVNKRQVDKVLSDLEEAKTNITLFKNELSEKIKGNKIEDDRIVKEISEIQTKLNESQNNANENKQKSFILTELLKAQQKRELQGIQGRLGDLGAIEEKYDIAITTACPSLDSIIVSKFDDAMRCVEYLRANKIGKATFLSLDKMDGFITQMNKPFEAPAGTRRLFDLIQIKNEIYRPVFYQALKDTLVCSDIDLATQVAYGATRYRVVTLQGVVIEFSGAMSGGGKPKRGGMSSKLASGDNLNIDQIAELNDRKRKKGQELDILRETRGDLERQLSQVIKDEGAALKESKKYQAELEILNQQLKELEDKNAEINRLLKSGDSRNENKQKELEKKIKENISQQKKLDQEMSGLLQEKSAIELKIVEIGGNDLKEQQILVDNLSKEYEDLEKEVSKMNLQINSTQKSLDKIDGEKDKTTKKLHEISEKIKELKQKSEQLENDTLEVMGSKKGATEKFDLLQADFDKDTKAKEQIENFLNEVRNALAKYSEQLEEAKQQAKKSKEEYQKACSDLEKIRSDYKTIIASYDFLPFLEELENFRLSAPSEIMDMTLNQSLLDLSIINEDPEGARKVKLTMDGQSFESIAVDQDLLIEHLEKIEKIGDRIKIKVVGESEKLKAGVVNLNAISEFRNRYLDYKEKMDDLGKVEKRYEEIKSEIENLKKNRFDEFMAGFNVINCKLKETYQLLTNGGDAELELIDSFDPFSEGVVFSVRPPKKSWKQMTKLSGGEKTLSSLALVFALHYFKPTPLYFMDEIDAALDFKNVAIVAKYIKERTKDAQFIIISLRNNMFELANKLIGVYKTFDTTKTVGIVPSIFLMPQQNGQTEVVNEIKK